MRFGLFGGTFDPLHRGHLDVAQAARRALALQRVSLAPAAVPPHRAAPVASAADRFAMVSRVVQDIDGLAVSDLDMSGKAPAYTMHTLDRLVARGAALVDWCVIVGADAFLGIASWHAYPQVLDRCAFVVVSRPDCAVTTLPQALPALAARMIGVGAGGSSGAPLVGARRPSSKPGIFLVNAPTAPVSSTEVRRRRAAGESIDGLVPEAVEEYIETHGLYVETR